ncbi:MAG: MBL fold metallo-hydrolase [Cyanobacteriota bacterium]|jgi:glyoxylase-like metal-dependent hydrolase (beta-lactamase superfamily II)
MNPDVKGFFDPQTYTITYVVADPESRRCAIIDPVWDYNPTNGRLATASADQVIAYVQDRGLTVDWILESHAHADHLTSAQYLKAKLGGKIAIGAAIGKVQATFKQLFNAPADFATDGAQFDHLFQDGETFALGNLTATVLATPGHTPACVTYVVGDAAFVGDTLFMPDYGTARTDFPGGDAATLYASIQKIFSLPSQTRLFMCHDYLPPGRTEYRWETTVAEERAENVHIRDGISMETFVHQRRERDRTLAAPVLILPSLQVNIRGGHLPAPEENGLSYLKIPLNTI